MSPKYDIKIFGSTIQVIRPNSRASPIYLRRLVSPTFIKVWFSVKDKDKDFDRSNWDMLTTDEKMFLSRITVLAQIEDGGLAQANSSLIHDVHQRLQLIEGAVVSGNLNRSLVEEYLQLIDKLSESGNLNKNAAAKMKACITNRYSELLG